MIDKRRKLRLKQKTQFNYKGLLFNQIVKKILETTILTTVAHTAV